jgi:hypothetical protein
LLHRERLASALKQSKYTVKFLAEAEAQRGLPEIFAVDNLHGCFSGIETVEQPGVYANAPRLPIPASVWLKVWAVAECTATASSAEMMCNQLRVPAIGCKVGFRRRQLELGWLIISIKVPALRTEGTSAAR